jgi:hypothetical protein
LSPLAKSRFPAVWAEQNKTSGSRRAQPSGRSQTRRWSGSDCDDWDKAGLAVVNDQKAAGVIGKYAIGGAVAATFYIEPTPTFDA